MSWEVIEHQKATCRNSLLRDHSRFVDARRDVSRHRTFELSQCLDRLSGRGLRRYLTEWCPQVERIRQPFPMGRECRRLAGLEVTAFNAVDRGRLSTG